MKKDHSARQRGMSDSGAVIQLLMHHNIQASDLKQSVQPTQIEDLWVENNGSVSAKQDRRKKTP